ncbi:MAG: M6 family metalloprotease domain-containing protein [Bacteroidales bacterium]|nr:M6 family metalloprotease domain-containing protein [Bacteroidales bacterium]
MKKILVIVIAALCCYAAANAVPAYRGLINYTQPDGSVIQIRLHGDEFFHWTTDASGQLIEMDDDGFYRPAAKTNLSARRAAGRIRRAAVNQTRRAPRKSGEPTATGVKRFLVILVEFSDVHFASETANDDFSALMNEVGYDVNGATGSARDFYYDNSGGAFEPIFDVYGPVRLQNNQKYYGGNTSSQQGSDDCPEKAVKEGCQVLNDSIDFSQYDNDGDGEVDLVFMYYAGKGEADGGGKNCIWPHQWELASAGISLTLDGKKVSKYACTNEIVSYGALANKMCGIGTACHEFGHAMGLPDFYDVDYDDNGEAGGLYDFSTMCSGSYNNSGRTPPYFNMEERIMLGWQTEGTYREFGLSGDYSFGSVSGNVAYRSATDKQGEYFAYECRNKTGWDAGLPEAGLLVYHVDKSSRTIQILNSSGSTVNVTASSLWSNWGTYNSINENGSHPCFYIIPATDMTSLNFVDSEGYAYNTGYTFTGVSGRNSFTGTSWNQVVSDVVLTNITYSAGNGKVSLHASVPASTLNYNVIANPGNGVYHVGDVFSLALEESEAQPVSSVEWYFDDEPVSGSSITLPAGTHVVEAHLTLVSGATKILELTLNVQ